MCKLLLFQYLRKNRHRLQPIDNHKGFTLIEIIVLILISGMVSLTVFTFLNWSMSSTHNAGMYVWELADATVQMEGVEAAYRRHQKGELDWADFKIKTQTDDRFNVDVEDIDDPGHDLFHADFETIRVTITDRMNNRQNLVNYFTEIRD